MLVTFPKNIDEKKCWQTSEKMLRKYVDNTSENVDEKIFVTLPKILMRNNIGKLPKNLHEKKCCQHFKKMLTKNVGYALKNVEEKC
jgi:hypothetical protein